jgi:hypothetical protein
MTDNAIVAGLNLRNYSAQRLTRSRTSAAKGFGLGVRVCQDIGGCYAALSAGFPERGILPTSER